MLAIRINQGPSAVSSSLSVIILGSRRAFHTFTSPLKSRQSTACHLPKRQLDRAGGVSFQAREVCFLLIVPDFDRANRSLPTPNRGLPGFERMSLERRPCGENRQQSLVRFLHPKHGRFGRRSLRQSGFRPTKSNSTHGQNRLPFPSGERLPLTCPLQRYRLLDASRIHDLNQLVFAQPTVVPRTMATAKPEVCVRILMQLFEPFLKSQTEWLSG